jgi:hypothetical protein
MERAINASDMRDGAIAQREAERAKDQARRELAATVLEDGGYPKIADKIRAGMRSSTWPENLVDPGLLLDLLEKLEA